MTTELVPVVDVTPAVQSYTGDQMQQAIAAYRELQTILDRALPDAIQMIGAKAFRKKPYWRAIRRAFSLTVELVDERREVFDTFDDGRDNFGYLVTYRASTLGGEQVIGDGACFAVEKAGRFTCPHPEREGSSRALHFPHETCPDFDPAFVWRTLPLQATLHNVRSHAHTRAFNRAISNLVGFGEVSAEEMTGGEDGEPGTPPPPRRPAQGSRTAAPISEPQRKRMWAIATGAKWAHDDVKALLRARGFEHSEDVTKEQYDAIVAVLERGPEAAKGQP